MIDAARPDDGIPFLDELDGLLRDAVAAAWMDRPAEAARLRALDRAGECAHISEERTQPGWGRHPSLSRPDKQRWGRHSCLPCPDIPVRAQRSPVGAHDAGGQECPPAAGKNACPTDQAGPPVEHTRAGAVAAAWPYRPAWWRRRTLAWAACLLVALAGAAIVISAIVAPQRHHPARPPGRGLALDAPATRAGATAPAAGATHRAVPAAAAAGAPAAAGVSPSRRLAIASSATVLVSTGAAHPIRLGQATERHDRNLLHVWDWSAGEASRVLDASTDRAMAVTPDGAQIVTTDGRLFDAATSKVTRLDHFDGDVRHVQFSPDGQTLLLLVREGNDRARVRILAFPSGDVTCTIDAVWAWTYRAAFSADSAQLLLMGGDRIVRRFDASTGKELARYEPALTNSVAALAISSDGKLVAAAGTRGDIHVWDVASSRRLHTLVAMQKPDIPDLRQVYSLAFSPDATRLAGGGIHNLVLWDTATGRQIHTFPARSGGAIHIRFSPDGRKVTTVSNFAASTDLAGNDLLLYPRVETWDAN